MKAKLTFCGGTGTVTGANFLLELAGVKILVDCGLVQVMNQLIMSIEEPFLMIRKLSISCLSLMLTLTTLAVLANWSKKALLVKSGVIPRPKIFQLSFSRTPSSFLITRLGA
jgi:predicted metal-dependent RNase